jgi:hypothetical protein
LTNEKAELLVEAEEKGDAYFSLTLASTSAFL